mmetsp:Transcript_15514/g.44326  ORF Transcript_15514/g.44326 Transcript_15514/m.44326 type:complete len:208 (+) Transcript_15514:89-712(+)
MHALHEAEDRLAERDVLLAEPLHRVDEAPRGPGNLCLRMLGGRGPRGARVPRQAGRALYGGRPGLGLARAPAAVRRQQLLPRRWAPGRGGALAELRGQAPRRDRGVAGGAAAVQAVHGEGEAAADRGGAHRPGPRGVRAVGLRGVVHRPALRRGAGTAGGRLHVRGPDLELRALADPVHEVLQLALELLDPGLVDDLGGPAQGPLLL